MPTDLSLPLSSIHQHALDWGGPATAQPILLIHGLASNAKIWNFVAPHLIGQYRTVALDQRSHGLSDPPANGDFSFAAVTNDMHEACAQLGFAKPVIVGHSWGGSVALEYALRYPQEVAGLVLVDGGFVGLNKRMTWPEAEERLAPPRLVGTPLAEFQARAHGFMGELYSDERFEVVMGNFEVRADNTIAAHLAFDNHMKIVRAMWEQDADVVYKNVHCPALFLPCLPANPDSAMEADFLKSKRESAAHIQTLMPQAKIDWLTDSIHDVPLQRPELVAEKISGFAASLA
jgi:pimeloyl-ACP methyl ester carboxylesterase